MIADTASWTATVASDPSKALVAFVGVAAATVAIGVGLRVINRRVRSLRRQVLVITLASLTIGALASFALAWLMVLDPDQLVTVLTVLATTAVIATVLVLVASTPLGRDARRLEATVKRIESGDRDARASIDRVDELGHVAHALDDLTRQLAALERERTEYEDRRATMLSSVSHDLRTPIAALRAAVEALVDGLAPEPDRYLASMQRDIEALSSLVDDLFLLVRIDSGVLELPVASVDLTEIADEAIEALAPVAATRDVTLALRADGAVRVHGNAAALGRVIRNLLDNAIHHSPPATTVTVTVDGHARRVIIIDEGPGFPAGFIRHAFEHFTRADPSRTRETGGAGLGLAIARGVVEAHGGQIWIGEPPGGQVAFELPAA